VSESERLSRKVAVVLPALRRSADAFMEHPNPRGAYVEYLWTVYWIVKASVPLMQAALAASASRDDGDLVAKGLTAYLPSHIDEEMHHDEWLLADLERLGMDRSAITGRAPSATIATLVGPQYYWIQHAHPVALMGYIAVLEGNPPAVAAIDRLAERTGYPPGAFRTLREHADLDTHHFGEFNDALDALRLSAEHSALIGVSALHTVRSIARVFDDIVDKVPASVPAVG
jgi:heme oxygenase